MAIPTVPDSTKSVKFMARSNNTKKWLHMLKIQDFFFWKIGCIIFIKLIK